MNQERIEKKTEETKKTNKKYMLRGILILLACYAAGILCGTFVSWMQNRVSTPTFTEWLSNRSGQLIIILLVGIDLITLVLGLPYSGRIHRNVLCWNGDDENIAENIEKDLMETCNVTNILCVILMLLFGIGLSGSYADIRIFPFIVVFWAIGIATVIFIQNRANKDNQLMNPEKSGSVFDLKFNDKQVKQMDEGERRILYQASYKAFRAVNITAFILWAVTVCGAITAGTGVFPIICICVMWLVSFIAFSRECARLQM